MNLEEGKTVKGGVGERPTTPPPSSPKGQGGRYSRLNELRAHVVKLSEVKIERNKLCSALVDIMKKDGPGLDMSPAGPCYEIAKKALDEVFGEDVTLAMTHEPTMRWEEASKPWLRKGEVTS